MSSSLGFAPYSVVRFAREHNLSLSVKGGGYNTAGWSVKGELVLDLALMNHVEVHPAASQPVPLSQCTSPAATSIPLQGRFELSGDSDSLASAPSFARKRTSEQAFGAKLTMPFDNPTPFEDPLAVAEELGVSRGSKRKGVDVPADPQPDVLVSADPVACLCPADRPRHRSTPIPARLDRLQGIEPSLGRSGRTLPFQGPPRSSDSASQTRCHLSRLPQRLALLQHRSAAAQASYLSMGRLCRRRHRLDLRQKKSERPAMVNKHLTFSRRLALAQGQRTLIPPRLRMVTTSLLRRTLLGRQRCQRAASASSVASTASQWTTLSRLRSSCRMGESFI